MTLEKKPRKISPTVIVLSAAISLIAGIMMMGWYSSHRRRVNASVEIAQPILLTDAAKAASPAVPQTIPDGEVAHLAIRVREAAALVMGLSVLSVEEQLRRQAPASLDSLLGEMIARNLLPPEVTPTSASGVLNSPTAIIHIRYRERPFGVEAASIGRNPIDGPPVIVRLDMRDGEQKGSVLLVAKKRESNPLPEPFSPVTEIARSNWTIEPLRERSFTAIEMDNLNQWARRHAANGQ